MRDGFVGDRDSFILILGCYRPVGWNIVEWDWIKIRCTSTCIQETNETRCKMVIEMRRRGNECGWSDIILSYHISDSLVRTPDDPLLVVLVLYWNRSCNLCSLSCSAGARSDAPLVLLWELGFKEVRVDTEPYWASRLFDSSSRSSLVSI